MKSRTEFSEAQMTKAIIEHGLSINIHRMVLSAKSKGDLPIHHWGAWQWTRGGEPRATINYAIDQAFQDTATLELSYNASGEPVKYTMQLLARPCRFGGWRWFAICPHTGLIVSKVYLPNGAKRFLARQAYRVAYQSQCDADGLDRALNRRNRMAFKKLKSDDPDFAMKPKWMRWKTYEKHSATLDNLEHEMNTAFLQRFGFSIDSM